MFVTPLNLKIALSKFQAVIYIFCLSLEQHFLFQILDNYFKNAQVWQLKCYAGIKSLYNSLHKFTLSDSTTYLFSVLRFHTLHTVLTE